jgi:hypothetical protein
MMMATLVRRIRTTTPILTQWNICEVVWSIWRILFSNSFGSFINGDCGVVDQGMVLDMFHH